MRIGAFIVTFAVAALAGVAEGATSSSRPPTVPCTDIIAWAKSGHDGGYRIVLGVVSVPPAYLRQVLPTHSKPWAYWSSAAT